ncbi:MAG TPA: hypothetical protein VKE98_15300 [Gemmataceae bacterium]|nr:hypothetical protein [Gemmataceae bacterium]
MRAFLSVTSLVVILATSVGCKKEEPAGDPKTVTPAAGSVQVTVDITAGLT